MKVFLKEINIKKSSNNKFPFNLPLFKNDFSIQLKKPITFIVGENGSGKSTLLENLAYKIGFNTLGGNKNHSYANESLDNFDLSNNMQLSWTLKQTKGFFFRAETFFNFARNLDSIANNDAIFYKSYGGKSLQEQSHGESFLNFFSNKVKEGLFIIDEPEAALSPEAQLSLVSILHQLSKTNECQFIIATHSPLLISTPNSCLFEIKNGKLVEKNYQESNQFELYKNFLSNPERFLHYLECDNNAEKK